MNDALRSLLGDLVTIPAGVLHRGTPLADLDALPAAERALGLPREWYLKECPRAEVPVPAYRIGRRQVSIAAWKEYDAGDAARWPDADPRLPAHDLAWAEADAYCTWLGERAGLPLRLPTETEWERAARGDDARTHPWGEGYDAARANLAEARIGGYLPVGSLPAGASPFGVLDLVGNGDEWTGTVFGPYPGAPAEVPEVDPAARDPHVTRGGSFRHSRDLGRCARRHALYGDEVGATFRIAGDLTQ